VLLVVALLVVALLVVALLLLLARIVRARPRARVARRGGVGPDSGQRASV